MKSSINQNYSDGNAGQRQIQKTLHENEAYHCRVGIVSCCRGVDRKRVLGLSGKKVCLSASEVWLTVFMSHDILVT